jgi:predicted PurR-regulated permease PerM
MSMPSGSDDELVSRGASVLMDVLIRAALILALALLCYRIFAPFLTLMAWSLILAVTLYPLQQSLARKMGGRQGLPRRCWCWPASCSSSHRPPC